jgi:DNA-binding transcriptional LysR family regulator
MEVRHLRYFLALAEELHFGRAAARAHIEQSPLSRSITQLEEELGVVLLNRSRQGNTLTPAGQALREYAAQILTTIERARRTVTDIGGLPPLLTVGLADGLVQPRLSELFRRWRDAEPQAALRIRELPAFEQHEALQTERVDIGLTFGMNQTSGMVLEPIWSDPIVVAVPCEHPLAGAGALTLRAVVAHTLVLCHPRAKPGLRAQLDGLLQGWQPTLAEPAGTPAGMIAKVGAGCGLGFLDANHARTLQRDDVVMVPLAEPQARLTVCAATKAGRNDKLSALVARVIALARSLGDTTFYD